MSKYTNIILFILLYLLSFFNYVYTKQNLKAFLNTKEKISEDEQIKEENKIDNAIYVIRNYKGDKNLDIEKGIPIFLDDKKKFLKKQFRFIVINNNNKKESNSTYADSYYYIEDKDKHNRLGIRNMDGDIGLQSPRSLINIFYKKEDDKYLWKIYPILIEVRENGKIYKKLYYYLQNKANKKYLTYVEGRSNRGTLVCNQNSLEKLNEKNYFILNKMYREKIPNESSELIEKEPIDVLIKYIDLSDPHLKREGIKQIKKDEDNGEIKYCVRSILKNIPWIRKIFILMPNERVKYFKEPEKIKDKIVYVKDKDLLGFDSASSPVFQFNLWKMKKFGLSENFILMDDDYFIGRPLKKTNFFYEENGKILPASITGDYYEMSKKHLEESLKPLLLKIEKTGAHSANGFNIMQKTSLLFLYSIFGDDSTRNGKPLIEASFSHNAIPVKQSDIKEIYDLIVKLYPYSKETLLAKVRDIRSLQPQTIFLSYAINKYERRVKIISSQFFDLTKFRGKITTDLFVVNTSDRNYPQRYYNDEINRLKQLFPDKTPYEVEEKLIKKNTKEKKVNDKIKDYEKLNKDLNKNNINNEFYANIIDFLKDTLDEKTKSNQDLEEIKEKIDTLNEKYNKVSKELEELTNSLKYAMNKNITLIGINSNNSSKYKLLEILILIIIFFCFILFLYRKGYLRENNNVNINYDMNGFESIGGEKEMNLINSKLSIS